MARIRAGYRRDEQGRLRRDPSRDIDIGVAAASVDGLAAIGRLSSYAPLAGDVALGAGPVERRTATPEELALAGVDRAAPGPANGPEKGMHVLRPSARIVADPARVQASRRRGGQRAKEIRAAAPDETTHTATHPEEGSVTAAASPATPGLFIDASPLETGDRPFPCNDCIHAPVCRLREDVTGFNDGAAMYESILMDEPGIRVRFEVVCDHHVRVDGAPWREADPYPRDGETLNLLRLHGGNFEAVARTLGVTGTTVRNWIRRMEAAGTVPVDVADLLAARAKLGRKAAAA